MQRAVLCLLEQQQTRGEDSVLTRNVDYRCYGDGGQFDVQGVGQQRAVDVFIQHIHLQHTYIRLVQI